MSYFLVLSLDRYDFGEGPFDGGGLHGQHYIHPDGNDEAFMRYEKCVVYNPKGDSIQLLETPYCLLGKGVCKFKLVDQYEPIENTVDYFMLSSEKEIIPETFDGNGTIHFELLEDSLVDHKFVDIKLSSQVLLSAIQFEMPDDKAIKRFNLFIGEFGIQRPDILSPWDTHDLHYGDLPTADTPKILKRKVYFPPIMADRVKLVILDGATEILAKMELLGMPNEKVYEANPIFDQIALTTDHTFWHKTTGSATSYVGDYGICPKGGMKFNFKIGEEITSDQVCKSINHNQTI